MERQELIPHLFRTEFSKITTVLGKLLGIAHLEVAEDITSETFLLALETWTFKGIPENPVAWLYSVAKNKARNQIHRDHLFAEKISLKLQSSPAASEEVEIDLSEKNIADSQLQMLFAICQPSIPLEAQIGLSLRILCGFGIDEIANAFLTNKETINKRLFRAKEKLREEKVKIEFPSGKEIGSRLDAVLITLYLLFNEGYYSESKDGILRQELCLEAMRLVHMLLAYEPTNLPSVNALLSLMCFHASRFEARKSANGAVILYQDQNEALWDEELIAKGAWYLHEATKGDRISRYHIEASIAWWHTSKADTIEKWTQILQLYNQLLRVEYTPVAALNRTYALAKVKGNAHAITAAEALKLADNHFYYLLLGVLYSDIDREKALDNFLKAHSLAKTNADRQTIQQRIDQLGK
ncbi:RNA polymerase subunit sigma [Pedobacter sp. KBW06]|uniref:RNA polymerase sigma factor n=1 Tax=Pedobacter sp. KBW06 TaxID=2153359 RepID=UPI000F5A4A40|nr:DUF6596 domain-containing protein [Pedobacter sp. KBW06]RQO75155.1 RNA polymerase subunit sigma [Pedobacter sp. KBW06]